MAESIDRAVLTFCLSDLEGSTRLWESQPEAMAQALARHDELIAAAVEAHGGRFLHSMGEGDSTVSAFESVTDAVRAAIDATRALADEPWPDGLEIRARFGLHTGVAQERDGVYFGTSLNIAARVRDQANGGELLLSETTSALAKRELPAGMRSLIWDRTGSGGSSSRRRSRRSRVRVWRQPQRPPSARIVACWPLSQRTAASSSVERRRSPTSWRGSRLGGCWLWSARRGAASLHSCAPAWWAPRRPARWHRPARPD